MLSVKFFGLVTVVVEKLMMEHVVDIVKTFAN